MMTPDDKIMYTAAFIAEKEIKDEDMKQELYLAALSANIPAGDLDNLLFLLYEVTNDFLTKQIERMEHETQRCSFKCMPKTARSRVDTINPETLFQIIFAE